MRRVGSGIPALFVILEGGSVGLFGPINIQHAIEMMIILLISIDIHELAHAIVADRLGDDTPRRMGELSLNPFVHMDQVGLILLVLTSISSFGFTYGRTHVSPNRLKFGPQRGGAIVALVGPLSNLAVAAVLGLILSLYSSGVITIGVTPLNFILLAFQLNILLFVLNLLPLPPLDGFTVLGGFLTARQMYSLAPVQQYGPLVILLLFVVNPGNVLGAVVGPAMNQIAQILCRSCFA